MTPVQVYALAAPWQEKRRGRGLDRPPAPAERVIEEVEEAPETSTGALAMLRTIPYGRRARPRE